MKYATLFALAAANASASGVGPNFRMVAPEETKKSGWNLEQYQLIPDFIKSYSMELYDYMTGYGAVTKAQWNQCDDDKGSFTYDPEHTVAKPDPLVPGEKVSL